MNKISNKINYFLTIQRMLSKVYLLKLNIENEDLPIHIAIFTIITLEEAYSELFSIIKERNKRFNQIAYLHIPNDWNDEDYKNLLENFDNEFDIKLVNNPLTK